MAEINLIRSSDKREGFSLKGKMPFFLYIMIFLLLLVVAAYGGLFLYERYLVRQIQAVELESAAVDFELSKADEERKVAISFQKRLQNIQALLGVHVFWTEFFAELEDYTLQGAFYETLQVDKSTRTIILSGVISDYLQLGKLIAGLEMSEYIRDVRLGPTALSGSEVSGYSFSMEIIFDSKILGGQN